jgi:hypothetical protein
MTMTTKDQEQEGSVPAEEPTFVLRAQDSIAPEIVREWAFRAARDGAPREKIVAARKIADDMEDWQLEHHRKVPD